MKALSCLIVSFLMITAASAVTVEQLKDMFSRGEYASVVREADQTLIADQNLTRSQAYQMIMLKAESLLRLGNRAIAAQEFGAAADIAPTLEQLAWARSTRVLLDRSSGVTYTPRLAQEQQPIDIIETDSRRRAMAALLADLRPSVQRMYDNALEAETLTELEDAVIPVSDAALLEVASTGKTSEMMPMLNELGKHAQNLIDQELARIQRQITHVGRLAAAYDDFGIGGRRGTSSRDRDLLFDMQAYLDRIIERVQMYRNAAIRLGGDTEKWDRILLQIIGLQTDIDITLRSRY